MIVDRIASSFAVSISRSMCGCSGDGSWAVVSEISICIFRLYSGWVSACVDSRMEFIGW